MKRKRRGNFIYNIILVLVVAVFFYSVYQLARIYAEYRKGDQEYEKIVEQVVEVEMMQEELVTTEEKEEQQEEKKEEEKKDTVKTHASLQIDFGKLCEINSDTVGWIQFDRPEKINYPIVLTTDNDKYLTTTFEGNKNAAGAIFMDKNNSMDFFDRNTFIYGHNMKNGSMFGQLRKYKSASYGAQNPYFYIYTLDGREIKYHIFSVCIVEDVSKSYRNWFEDDAQFMDYLRFIKSISLYNVDVELTEDSKIVSLSTCTNVTEKQRLLVHGVKVSEK